MCVPRIASTLAGVLGCLSSLLWVDLLVAQDRAIHWPIPQWETAAPGDVGMDGEILQRARDYALTGEGSGYIVRGGKLVMTWGDPKQRYDLKSTTKSFGATALALAMADGKIALSDKAGQHHPSFAVPPESNRATNWIGEVTIAHLATHTAGFEKRGGYEKLVFKPGTRWLYSDGGPNWLAECVTLVYERDVDELMFERVFDPLGITRSDLKWRRNQYRDATIAGVARREFGSGIHANVNAMARFGYLYLRKGSWQGRQILPASFVARAGTTVASVVGLPEMDAEAHGNASDHYGLLWWNNADGTLAKVPRDAFWTWGLYDSLILVIPSLDLVVARAGKSWERKAEWDGHYAVLAPFFEPIVDSVRPAIRAPYPASPVIAGIEWAPASTIIRRARGGDNWPITWGDDDRLYTAYGDGRGFEPFVEKKLSMGLATVTGMPPDIRGENLRASTAERVGDGARAAKVSSLLMVDGVLTLLARNLGNAQLATSGDRGKSWTWSDWKFRESFGYPVFLNFGKNYADARDGYVYIYSHDADSAYERADHMVLARVPAGALADRQAYEFFVRALPGNRAAVWTKDIRKRGSVFTNPGQCYRSSVSYHPGTRRYLWCQTGSGEDTRFRGGLGIYDAPEPWGPWTTVVHVAEWDVGPGETSCLPTKWMDPDGRTVHLVFSGDDCFSVRRARLRMAGVEPAVAQ